MAGSIKLSILIISAAILPISSLVAVKILENKGLIEIIGIYFFFIAMTRILSSWIIGGMINFLVHESKKHELPIHLVKIFIYIIIFETLIIAGILYFSGLLLEIITDFYLLPVFLFFLSLELNAIAFARRQGHARFLFLVLTLSVILFIFMILIIDISKVDTIIFLSILRMCFVSIFLWLKIYSKSYIINKSDISIFKVYKNLMTLKVNDLVRSINSNIDKQIIFFILGPTNLAIYGIIQQLTSIINLSFGSIANIWFPRLIEFIRINLVSIQQSISIVIKFLLLSVIVCLVCSPFAFNILINAYSTINEEDYIIFIMLCLSAILQIPYLFLNGLIVNMGGSKYILLGSIFMMIVGISLLIILGKIFYLSGIATSIVIMQLISLIYILKFFKNISFKQVFSTDTNYNDLKKFMSILKS